MKDIRKKIFLTAYAGGVAHLASAFSLVEIMYVLYQKGILRYDPKNPAWEERDRLILSKGHGSLALYTALCRAGFFGEDLLYTFLRPGSILGGEPKLGDIPGVEATTGSLGHGLSMGVGMAIAHKLDHKDCRTYVIIGDGESQEGTIWEAVMSAAHFKLDNLTVILDCNKIQKMGPVEESMSISEWRSKWDSFGWLTDEISDGHNIDEIYECLSKENNSGKPRLVIAHTIKGKGVSIMENDHNWHFKMPGKRELKVFMEELNITEEELAKCREHI